MAWPYIWLFMANCVCNCSFSPESSQWCWYFSGMAHRSWHNNQASVHGPTGNKWYSNIFFKTPWKGIAGIGGGFVSLLWIWVFFFVFMQIITINGMFPGPLINATTNDNIHVNVFNDMDESLLITWYRARSPTLLPNWFSLNPAIKK